MTIRAFEEINQVQVSLRIACVLHRGQTDLELTAEAVGKHTQEQVVKSLASVSVKCSSMNLRSLEAALIHVLYMLDGKLAEEEYAGIPKKG